LYSSFDKRILTMKHAHASQTLALSSKDSHKRQNLTALPLKKGGRGGFWLRAPHPSLLKGGTNHRGKLLPPLKKGGWGDLD
ncbi:MAG: hypothetical protein KDJ22_04285, partial [Candidatus Competibacteraceae bacterium]|nr:hypothetical protein [Candidatus Competibacteraceae bacterium]